MDHWTLPVLLYVAQRWSLTTSEITAIKVNHRKLEAEDTQNYTKRSNKEGRYKWNNVTEGRSYHKNEFKVELRRWRTLNVTQNTDLRSTRVRTQSMKREYSKAKEILVWQF